MRRNLWKVYGIHLEHNSFQRFSYTGYCSLINKNTEDMPKKSNSVTEFLRTKIKASGPVTVAEFMKSALANPVCGYYMQKDVFGVEGDFVTSPEISQLFGEMIALWFINEWTRIGSPKPMQVIELGPGRGTMMKDFLRVFHKLKLTNNVSCHLVEMSEELSQLQAKSLGTTVEGTDITGASYKNGVTQHGVPVHWYYSIEDVPRQFSCVVAHEFFDALPIHKFQKTKDGWREVLIDIDPNDSSKFRFVISRMGTPASAIFVKVDETREHVEVSPQTGVVVQHLAQRLEEYGGIALIADYGHCGDKTDTFRAFRKHQLADPLEDPGNADLTADVDFKYIQDCVSDKLVTFGPVTQRHFLLGMHIEKRLEMLINNCENEEEKALLKSGFHMMTDEDKMGCCFKFLSLYPLVLKDYLSKRPPPGFC